MITDRKFSSEQIDPRLVSVPRRKSKFRYRFHCGIEIVDEVSADSVYESYRLRIRNSTDVPSETHRLSMIEMDWSRVSAKDLLLFLNPYLPENGRILSVAVYPSEFRIQRMEDEEINGPMEDEVDDGAYMRRDYLAVAECDSIATANYLFESCDRIEFEIHGSSNQLDFAFLPNSTKFKHPPLDFANEEEESEVLSSVPDPAV